MPRPSGAAKAYVIRGTPRVKKPVEVARQEENRRRRKAFCILCGNERDKRSFPICPNCTNQ